MTADLFENLAQFSTNHVGDSISSNDLFSQGQIRLSELSVFNWGSFHGLHTAAIDPEGTLVTGDNGSGKSTFIDGLMALLLPAGKATFNVAAAQGDRSDRSLLSYMRGSFGSAHDGSSTRVKSKREKGVVTGLRALYRADDSSCITLAALFWTTSATNTLSDVKRVYLVAKRNLQLKELLDAFGEGNTRQLKQWLRDDTAITDCDSNFSDYQELYRKHLYMDNKNASALLSRALGLKKIDDLTKLIRELVLEPSGVKEDAKNVVEEFADLVAIHEQLIDAKEQYSHLSRLPELADSIAKATKSLDSLLQEKSNLATYFGEALSLLCAENLADIDKALDSISREIRSVEIDESDAQSSLEKRHEEYLNLGGDKIESLKKDIKHAQENLESVIRQSSNYQRDCQNLGLSPELTESAFLNNKTLADGQAENLKQLKNQGLESFAEIRAELSKNEAAVKEIENDIREIEARPNSNIHKDYLKLRDQIVDSLNMAEDELVFIGELLDVKEEERSWQGAIERALGGLKLTLLVPQKSYSMVTRWLNVRHTGLHVRVQVVLGNQSNYMEFSERGFLRKLVWKEHSYRDWLKKHLSKYELQCVGGTDELDATPFSMTKEGLVHKEKGRFEKKDQTRIDNRRDWYLGFSNKSRLAILHNDKNELEQVCAELKDKDRKSLDELQKMSDKERLWERLSSYSWEQINAPYWQRRLESVKADLNALEKSGGDLDVARSRWDTAKEHLKKIQESKGQLLTKKGSLGNDKSHAQEQLEKYQQLAATGMTDDVRQLLQSRVGEIRLDDAHRQADFEKAIDGELDKIRSSKSTAENVANGIMGSFRGKDKWQPITADWPTGLEGLQYYLEHYSYIETEGLPELIDQFKERLNKHATQSLARIKTKLESEREDILERIDTINQVLKRTEFKQGSHLRLGSRREKFPHVLEFERKVRSALSQATSDDHEARFRLLSDVVDILDKASAPGTSTNEESKRLLDPRYQMSFFAEEVDSQTLEVRDVLESSSGKSGGEKESFAGTIVAASLAYVLTPDGHDRPIYCTVFLDEAFSNTAEAVSRRVLRVFKELHIHVNLITPYKNLNLARESARSLLIAERDPALHESHLCEVTWEEIDQRMAQQKQSAQIKEIAGEIELKELGNTEVEHSDV
ncbi:ATP-binding protein [Pectobacterium carotovorum]|uniref:ATP-binding protein n=1 Tax=Pectobacterium carotovorum TaxID=554 RepID=UPI00208060D6|nr:ATP-binding protein [Pectobacterium carotovorum]GKW38750.1 ATP-binding protein [Pectobacterium carotovorum subsp. carotovorum]